MAEDRERALQLLPAQASERLRNEVATAPRDEALTLAYQGSLSKERRRKGGVHYTPLSIAQRLLERALELNSTDPALFQVCCKWREEQKNAGSPCALTMREKVK